MNKLGHLSICDVHSSTGDVNLNIYNYILQLVHKPGDFSVSPLPTNSNINCINCIIIHVVNMHACEDR